MPLGLEVLKCTTFDISIILILFQMYECKLLNFKNFDKVSVLPLCIFCQGTTPILDKFHVIMITFYVLNLW